jgi:hypothetical protein
MGTYPFGVYHTLLGSTLCTKSEIKSNLSVESVPSWESLLIKADLDVDSLTFSHNFYLKNEAYFKLFYKKKWFLPLLRFNKRRLQLYPNMELVDRLYRYCYLQKILLYFCLVQSRVKWVEATNVTCVYIVKIFFKVYYFLLNRLD